jgi:uncharacterized DUF497 family protein
MGKAWCSRLKFEWDPIKNAKNLRKHKVDFEEAKYVFSDEMALELYDEEHSVDEDRYIIIGVSSKTRELYVCHCYRNGGDVVRIFSARRATKEEINLYRDNRR